MKRSTAIISDQRGKMRLIFIATVSVGVLTSASLVFFTLTSVDDGDSQKRSQTVMEGKILRHQPSSVVKSNERPLNEADLTLHDEPVIEPFVVQSLLYKVELDDEGNPVVNDQTRRLLESSLLLLGRDQSQLNLDLLDEMIRAGLPGSAGAQVADVFRSYYEYKSAESELVASMDANNSGSGMEAFDRLVQLRHGYLGYELTSKLFAEEEAYMKKVFAIMKKAETEEKLAQ